MEHFEPDEYKTSGKGVCRAWVLAAVLMAQGRCPRTRGL